MRIGLIAHDNMKKSLLDWVEFNKETLRKHSLYATKTTGELIDTKTKLAITTLKSGPLGGDQQIGSLLCQGEIDLLIFFWDGLEPHPHDVDVKALLRLAVVYDIPTACNRATANFLISSPMFNGGVVPF